jgi:hypothetical protein
MSHKALSEAITIGAERAGAEFERLLFVEAHECGKCVGFDERDGSGAGRPRSSYLIGNASFW